ncbi:uncharacterized protein LOC129585579 isoform X2 [Paramacrobiotus metropolitanus]|nr:uncharacterized protein LOC129585579 isoform X2 [Paramacrobiotus metropolitanus]XP_055334286.1 uncharacterized protein LOC129585579 isoform X2 [Paramacrobiotus metropolitanus]XP_055334287.1 uncharacterized protein LOC129585579 isoform X2 [Paramacrobiotus metropolitanus]XP_055334288.1 uncharacterized protein LOC129585579 isoform X2 [Paramacrobiotus metropolitanus]XP_055334289.1 uncharacterized protein LOC129585579 isoform X2 [Paramacrobiotus metropolitanus]XP_055334290.1 uncharacterized prot
MPRCIYQPLLADASQMSHRNTVAVRMTRHPDESACDGDTWWLGYIQDIEGERAFIHFNSTTAEARWMHMEDVWPLPTYRDALYSRNATIFAALRDEDNGPFCFRPAVMLDEIHGCIRCLNLGSMMFGIRTDVSSSSNATACAAHTARPCVEVVLDSQVSNELPPSGPPLLERRSGLLYTKHWIPFPQASALLSEPSDKFRIIKHVRAALKHKIKLGDAILWDCCRFHLRIGAEGCVFVVVGLATDAESTHWMARTLSTVLETHLASRALLPPIHNHLALRTSENMPCEAGIDIDAPTLTELTPWLLSDILSHLDVHSQMKATRVCAIWQMLLSHPRMKEHVSISFESCWHLQVDTDTCFKAASLLTRFLSSATISLTVLRVFPPRAVHDCIEGILSSREINLPILVLRDHIDMEPKALSLQKRSRLTHGAVVRMLFNKHICDFILLYNWKVSILFGQQMYDVFEEGYIYKPDFGAFRRPLPAHERQWMLRLSERPISPPQLAIDELQITIPKLLLSCSNSEMGITSRFMCALNDNFPPVTPDMLAKVTAVHARWLRTLDYPDDWHTIRNYLLLYSGFHSDGRPKFWEEVDLRYVNISTWSKMAIYGINELFRV